MVYIYIAIAIFVLFILFQTLYTIVPLFKNEKKNRLNIHTYYRLSVIVPAFNEEKVIENCITGFLQLKYRNADLIIVNDGSNDHTLSLLTSYLHLKPYQRKFHQKLAYQTIKKIYKSKRYSKIYVIDKENGGKADALNAGICFSNSDIVITLDADSILESRALCEINASFQNENIIACGGNVLIAQAFVGEFNNLKPSFKMKGIIRYQFLQYLTAFFLHKRTQASLDAITVIAGAFGAFRKASLIKVNGFRKTIGEDMDITLKLHKWIKENKTKEKIAFVPSALCYTECPDTFKKLYKQRIRWQKAFIDCLIHYRSCFFRKFTTRFSIFFIMDQFLIGTLSAFVVITIPFTLLFYDSSVILFLVLGFCAVSLFMYQMIVAVFISHRHNITLSVKDVIKILLFLPIEVLVFRMINLFIVAYGTLSYFRNSQEWNKTERTGEVGWKRVQGA